MGDAATTAPFAEAADFQVVFEIPLGSGTPFVGLAAAPSRAVSFDQFSAASRKLARVASDAFLGDGLVEYLSYDEHS